MYFITITSIHSHKDANTLHNTHMRTPAITNAHMHTLQYLHVLLPYVPVYDQTILNTQRYNN